MKGPVQPKHTLNNKKLFHTKLSLSTQLQEVGSPLGISMSHTEANTNDGVVLWRRLEMEILTISPFLSVSNACIFIFGHATAFEAADLCGAVSTYSRGLYVTDTHSKCHI